MKLFKLLSLLLLTFVAPEVFAGVFEVAPTDQSKKLLGMMLGGNVGAISLGGGANPILSQMFEKFNFIIIAAGVIVMSYVGIVSAINTAREGQAMGSKFSLWIPLRGLLGMLLMIPAPASGYSIIQMTVIWVVLNGVGAANAIWNVVLNQLARGVAAVGNVNVDIPDSSLQSGAQSLVSSLACLKTLSQLNLAVAKDLGRPKIIIDIQAIDNSQVANNKMMQSALVYFGYASKSNPNKPDPAYGNLCGTFTIGTEICDPRANQANCQGSFNSSSLTQRLNIKIQAFMSMVDAINPLADTIASESVSPPPGGLPALPPGYIQAAMDAYRSGLAMLAGGVFLNINQAPNTIPSGSSSSAASWGEYMRQYGRAGARGAGEGTRSLLPSEIQTTEEYIRRAGEISSDIAGTATDVAVAPYNFVSGLPSPWERNVDPPVTGSQVNELKQFGWVYAGVYYSGLAQSSNANPLGADLTSYFPGRITNFPVPAAGIGATPQTTPGWTENFFNILNNEANRQKMNTSLRRSQDYLQIPPPAPSLPALGPSKASTGNGFMDQIVGLLSSSIRTPIVNFVQKELMGTGAITRAGNDPLVTLGRFGWSLMMAGESAIFAIIALSAVFLGFGALCAAMGSGFAILMTILSQIFLLCFTIIVSLWAAGATLGVYIPLVPYIIFTSAAIGWFLSVIESLVGAPIIALALTQPAGEELPSGLKASIGILANIFLRPTLMIFGFVMASGVIRGALTFINFGFMKVVNVSLIPSFFSFIPTIGIYVLLVIGVVNQAFQLIYELPQKILRYMGIHDPTERDIKELISGARGGFEKGAAMGGSAVKGAFEGKEGKGGAAGFFQKSAGRGSNFSRWFGGGNQ